MLTAALTTLVVLVALVALVALPELAAAALSERRSHGRTADQFSAPPAARRTMTITTTAVRRWRGFGGSAVAEGHPKGTRGQPVLYAPHG